MKSKLKTNLPPKKSPMHCIGLFLSSNLNTAMNFKEFFNLREMPLRKAERIGKGWTDTKNLHWWDKPSVQLLQSDKALQKIHNAWKDTQHTYDFYFLKAKGMRDTLERGEVSLDYVHETLGQPNFQSDPEAITVIFTNNRGDQKVPMTAWIMAHRFGHAMQASERYGLQGGIFRKFQDQLERDFSSLLDRVYGFRTAGMMSGDYERYGRSQKMIKELMQSLGTMRSARQANISRPGEFAHELIAQFLLNGKVQFNKEAPVAIGRRMAWGNPTYDIYSKARDEQSKQEISQTISDMEEHCNMMIDGILDRAVGKIYVM